MLEALIFGILGSSSLVLGGIVGAQWAAPTRFTGVMLAFASGTLISALSFELFPQAVELAGVWVAGGALLAGGVVFVVVNTWLDAHIAASAGNPENVPAPASVSEKLSGAEADQREKIETVASKANPAVGFALLAAVTLDGVPENLALGVSLLGPESASGALTLLVAIFCSNFPEALVGAVAMRHAQRSRKFTIIIWTGTAALLTIAVMVGYVALADANPVVLATALAFAGGAVLASLADTLMPEAFEHGRPLNAFATALGFLLSFVVAGGGG